MRFSNLDIPYEEFVLDNGLRVVVHEDHKTPIVAVNIWYHVGSKNEKPGKTGFAHLFEHLMFGGSEHLQGSFIDAMERIGATDLNGTTSEDRTNYFENVPSSALDYALFAESDRMGHFYNTISQEILDLQRGVVQNEKRQGDNQPYAIVEDLVVKVDLSAEHPYAHTVIGSMEDLDSATLDDVREWFKTYYTPSNAVLVLAGDITVSEAREKARRYFNDIAPGPPVAHQRTWIAKMAGEHRESVQDRVPQGRIYKVWNTPARLTIPAGYLPGVGRLTDALRTGHPQAPSAGTGGFARMLADPRQRDQYLRMMDSVNSLVAPLLVDAYDFGPHRDAVDVGGARGNLMAKLTRAYPHLNRTSSTCRRWPTAPPHFRGMDLSVSVDSTGAISSPTRFPRATSWSSGMCCTTGRPRTCSAGQEGLRRGPPGGALLVYDAMLDDEPTDLARILVSINMLLVTGGGSEYPASQCEPWMRDAGSPRLAPAARLHRHAGHRPQGLTGPTAPPPGEHRGGAARVASVLQRPPGARGRVLRRRRAGRRVAFESRGRRVPHEHPAPAGQDQPGPQVAGAGSGRAGQPCRRNPGSPG